jgi:hypothetical protein
MRDGRGHGDKVSSQRKNKMARTSSLAKLSMTELQHEIARRSKSVGTLERRRDRLLKKLADLDAQIAANGGAAGGRGGWSRPGGGARTRARNESNLLEALQTTLKGKTMSVTDAADAVQKAGYTTTSPNFRTIVNQTLLKKKFFKRVERGIYTSV